MNRTGHWWNGDISKKRVRAASYKVGETTVLVAGRPDYPSSCDSEFDLDEIDAWMNITDRFVPQPMWTFQAWFPWRESGPPSPEVIHGSLRTLHYWIDQLKLSHVFIHCDAGTHRSVTVFGAYLLTYHPEQADAIAQARTLYGKEENYHSCPMEYWRSYIRDYPELEKLALATKNAEDTEWGYESLDTLGNRLELSWSSWVKFTKQWESDGNGQQK